MRTNQEIFDNVVTNLRAQGRQCCNERGRCVYRGENGMKCAAGWELPDELYNPAMEDTSIGALPNPNLVDKTVDLATIYPRVALANIGYTEDNFYLLSALQIAHDSCPPERWEQRWDAIAVEYGLVVPKVEEK